MRHTASPLRRPIAVTLGLALGVLGFQAWCWQLGQARMARLSLPSTGSVAVRIELPFVPEAFNITRLQAAGRLVRIEGGQAWLRDVPAPALRALAREYWIGTIHPWDGR